MIGGGGNRGKKSEAVVGKKSFSTFSRPPHQIINGRSLKGYEIISCIKIAVTCAG